jgi:hypothetical protein
MRKYATNAERQAAYRSRQREASLPPLYLPALCPLSQVPSKGRWRVAIDLAARLLDTVAEEMQAYSDERSEYWHEGESAQRFHENLDRIIDLQEQIDDLKSDF